MCVLTTYRSQNSMVLDRGAFSVKLTKLKLQGPSLAWAPCNALGSALNKNSLSYLILYL